ncbi:MAG TPA: hypothetical protein PLZ43_00520, partial [bacterium]|nr:hypothetical protein [bacterium]
MEKFLLAAVVIFVLFLANSCVVTSSETNWDSGDSGDSGNNGNFKISLKLPIDTELICSRIPESSEDIYFTYCINQTDKIKLSIYSTSDPSDPYLFDDFVVTKVSDDSAADGEYSISAKLSKNSYYRFFVEVTNSNEKLKLTGGIDGVYYPSTSSVDIFLGAVGDFVRVVGDRSDDRNDYNSLKSYFDTAGSKGAAAVALKNGKIYLS